MNLKDKSLFLGLGCCGGKQAKKLIEDYGYKGIAVNGSEQDLKALGNINKYHLSGFDGFGGHREKSIDCLSENEDFLDYVEHINEKIIFVLFGGGGSTGSGCATILTEMLSQNSDKKRIVCPVITLPSSDEAIIKHSNAYQAVQELQEIDGLGATFFINNDIDKDYEYINSTFAKFIDTFLSNDAYGELNNFDESERLEMLMDSGAMVLSLMKNGTDSSVMLDKLTQNGIFAPIESIKVCEHIGIIHASNNNKDINVCSVISEVGQPQNVFEGYNGRNTLIAVSGLDFPVTHVSKLGNIAKAAYEERKRERKQVRVLDALDFIEESQPIKQQNEVKKPSKLDVLKKRMKK